MTNTNTAIISDEGRAPIVVQGRGNGIYLQAGTSYLILSSSELQRLIDFSRDDRPPALTPAKAAAKLGVIQRYPTKPSTPRSWPVS